MRKICLAAPLLALSLQAAEPSIPDPLWDGHESVAAYAQRAHLDATKTFDLGNGVKLEFVLIPAGRFIMGTPEPAKPEITVLSAQVSIGIGATLSLIMLSYLLLRKRTGRRFSFSLRWLMAFSLACSVMVWGGTRWYSALVQIREYEAGLDWYNAMNDDEKPAHPVLITKAFYMGKYVGTQEQYQAVIGTNPSQFKWPQNPVESVSWFDATAFCKKLSEQLRASAWKAQLPSEAQWEYACRAGTRTIFHSGNADSDLDAVAWYGLNSGGKPHPVGGKKANSFGLYDMNGNVMQWCQDPYRPYESLNAAGTSSDVQGDRRVLRGGSYTWYSKACRSTNRGANPPDTRLTNLGFRIVLVQDK